MKTSNGRNQPSRFLILLIYTFATLCAAGSTLGAETEATVDDKVRVYYELNSDDSYQFFADNNYLIPAYIKVDFPTLENLIPSVKLPIETVLPATSSRVALFELNPGSGSRVSFSFNYIFAQGDPINVRPDESFAYLLPYEHGKKYRVEQGFNGEFTHFDQNQFAIDFSMPEGTPVAAARDGLVIDVKQDSNVGGPGPEFNDYGNYIRIYHSDGTFGNYVHLRQNGSSVKVGQVVKAGDIIGFSGNTGRTTGPHLHFDIRVPTKKGTSQSIPIRFLNYDSTSVIPELGNYYYSFHPGKPAFPILLGRLIRNEDFKNYIASVPASDKATVRSETIDETQILYVSNGLNRAIQAEVRFTMKNLTSSMGNPIRIRVPARSELFLTIMNVIDPTEAWSLDMSWVY